MSLISNLSSVYSRVWKNTTTHVGCIKTNCANVTQFNLWNQCMHLNEVNSTSCFFSVNPKPSKDAWPYQSTPWLISFLYAPLCCIPYTIPQVHSIWMLHEKHSIHKKEDWFCLPMWTNLLRITGFFLCFSLSESIRRWKKKRAVLSKSCLVRIKVISLTAQWGKVIKSNTVLKSLWKTFCTDCCDSLLL